MSKMKLWQDRGFINSTATKIPLIKSLQIRVSNRNSVAHCVAERNAIFTAISARFVAPNLRLKVSFLAHQHCGILGAIKVYFPINLIYFWLSNFLTPTYIISVYTWLFISKHSKNTLKIVLSLFCNVADPVGSGLFGSPGSGSGKIPDPDPLS